MLSGIRKKLLILGATAGEIPLVKRAQKLGVYVIVADYNVDYSLSPAKYVADERWDISWSDLDALEAKCRENGVDGVAAGYSEFRVENQIRLCARLGLPCYATLEQLEITRDKAKFKAACRANGVPTVKDFSSMEEVDDFPVIVKPVDRAGSIGISVASNVDELKKACEYALEKSVEKKIVVEKFVENATKVDLYYAIIDGNIELLTTCDTVDAKDNGRERVVQSAWLYPSRKESTLLQKVDPSLRKMIANMGIVAGCIFFSGFINELDETAFFECGFRLEGGHQHNYASQKGPFNYLDLFIASALNIDASEIYRTPDPRPLHCVSLNLYAKKGVLSQITGLDRVEALPDCSLAHQIGRVGQTCDDSSAILSKIALLQFVDESPKQLQKDVETAYSLFGAFDENGRDIIYDRIEASIVGNWWETNGKRN